MVFEFEERYRIGDQILFWEKNKYGYNLCHRGVIENLLTSDGIAYVRRDKDDREFVVTFREIEKILTN